MIISHRHKFIFIKTHKTAGTSIEIALSNYCGKKDIITPILPEDEQIRFDLGFPGAQNYLEAKWKYNPIDWKNYFRHKRCKKRFWHHIDANMICQRLSSDIWSSYFKFCFDRNPWDKVVSMYYFRLKFKYDNLSEKPSFEQFIESGEAFEASDFSMYSNNGIVVVDHVAKFENLSQELEYISNKLGLPKLNLTHAKGNLRPNRQHYRDLFTINQKEKIENVFRREIEYLNYHF